MREELEDRSEVRSESAETRGHGPIRLEYAAPVRDKLSYAGLGCALSIAHFVLLVTGLVVFVCTGHGPVFIEQQAPAVRERIPYDLVGFGFLLGTSLLCGFGVAHLVMRIRRRRAARRGTRGQAVDEPGGRG